MSSKILEVSKFFKEDISALVLGAFFSRYIFIDDNKYIVTIASYKKSIKIDVPNFDYEKYIDQYIEALNNESLPYKYWIKKNETENNIKLPLGIAFYILKNDINIDENSFFNKLYAKLLTQCDWIYDEELNENKKSFIRGFIELRGSIDTTANFISQDYFYNYNSNFEMKKARILVDYLNVPYYMVNINFRQLQKQYYTNENQRNTQLRLNIYWFMHKIGIINEYKARIFMLSRNIDKFKKVGNIIYFDDYSKNHRPTNLLDERLNYYFANIIGKDITKEDIKRMRSNLGFDGPIKSFRNQALVEYIRNFTPDECLGCKNKYNLEDRTFINKKTGKPYLEIHHMISLGNNKELDDENNLVKLCSSCHNSLKKGVSNIESQKELIKEIYNNASNVLDFAQHFFDTKDFYKIIELTADHLK